ncbi:MAG: hypothetical protein ACYC5M_17560 [Anaerolineae bacterium]
MARDIVELLEPFLSDDPLQWSRLASDVQFRRLQLLLLREIVLELRTLNARAADPTTAAGPENSHS